MSNVERGNEPSQDAEARRARCCTAIHDRKKPEEMIDMRQAGITPA